MQLMETYTEEEPSDESGSEEENEEKKKPNFITYVNVESADCSDSDAVLPAIRETQNEVLVQQKGDVRRRNCWRMPRMGVTSMCKKRPRKEPT